MAPLLAAYFYFIIFIFKNIIIVLFLSLFSFCNLLRFVNMIQQSTKIYTQQEEKETIA